MASGGLITCCLGAVIWRPLAFCGGLKIGRLEGKNARYADPVCCYEGKYILFLGRRDGRRIERGEKGRGAARRGRPNHLDCRADGCGLLKHLDHASK